MRGSPIACVNKHLAQRTLAVAEVEQRHGADNFAPRDRDPEVARPLLVESRDILEIGLILQGDRDVELVPLDADDERAYALHVLRGKGKDLNHIKQR